MLVRYAFSMKIHTYSIARAVSCGFGARAMFFSAFLAVAALPALAEKQYLWPEGAMPDEQAHQIAAMTDSARKPDFDPAAHRAPYLDWFEPPANPNGVCMILISGGAYNNCCDVGLIKEWRKTFTALGCQCVNLVYRTPRPKALPIYQSAWEDGQRAVRLVRAAAEARGFSPDQIGVVSMSAGSHLALLLATSSLSPAYEKIDDIDNLPCNIAFSLAFAPAFVLSDGNGKPNSRLGQTPDAILDAAFKFDAATCPVCLMHGGADKYSPNGSSQIYRRLRSLGVPAELHIARGRGHGAHGLERGIEFMRALGFLGPLHEPVDIMARFPDDSARAVYAKEPLWPQGKTPDFQPDQCEPYIEWHIPSNLTTRAIQIIWSGGAYAGNKPDGFEVAPVRRYLNSLGMAVVTLKYRTPRPAAPLAKHTTAWQDARRAIRLVRAAAPAKNLDPNRIGVMGSSAGGHLALLCASSSRSEAYEPIDDADKLSAAVQWAVCFYPAYLLTDGLDGKNSAGGNRDSDRFAPEFVFDPATPPVFFIHGDGDGYSAMGSVKAWEHLRRMGIQGEVHTLARRGHCFQRAASPGTGSFTFLDTIWKFISSVSK